jgi:PTS system nitrogen regulatory IIA component
MTDLRDLIAPEAIVPSLRVNNKKQALGEFARAAAPLVGRTEAEILLHLTQREKEGSTGAGNGIALPHARLDHLERASCLFVRLERAIDFDASDEQPVDLFFILFTSATAGGEHLKALSRISRLIRDPLYVNSLRQAATVDDLMDRLYGIPQAVREAS